MTLSLAELPADTRTLLAGFVQGAPILPTERASLPADLAGLVAAAEASEDRIGFLEEAIGADGIALLLRARQEQPGKPVGDLLPDEASLEAARLTVAEAIDRANEDAGAPFEPVPIQAMVLLHDHDAPAWARARADLRKAKVSVRAIERALRPLVARRPSSHSEGSSGPDRYEVRDGCLCHVTYNRDGVETAKPLSNFVARIIAEEAHDDGAEVRRFYRVEGQASDGSELPAASVLTGRFGAMDWVGESWGWRAIISAGSAVKDNLRVAIQTLSRDVETRTVYLHTGWRREDGGWLFLHAGGAIGRDGNSEAVSVDLGGRLASFHLELSPDRDAMRAAVRASLDLLRLAPERASAVLLAAVYRAPLCEVAPMALGIYVEGQSGSHKTSLCAVMQAHYGRTFSQDNLPAGWASTANALELQAHAAKDCLLIADDFCPSTAAAAVRLTETADRVFRGAGNRQGRGRMSADGRMRAERYARGVLGATGEELPAGFSLRARLGVVSLRRGDVRLDYLTDAQADAAQGVFARAIGGYVAWLAGRLDRMREDVPARQRELRDTVAAAVQLPHPRGADMAAALLVGFETFLRFALDLRAVTEPERDDLWGRAWAAILQAGQAQAEHVLPQDVAARFLALLDGVLSSGRAHLEDIETGEEPPDGHMWGWRDGCRQGPRIGWLQRGTVYLDKESTWAAVQELAARQGGQLPVSADTLVRRLGDQGHLAERNQGKNLIQKRIRGYSRRYCIALHARILCSGGDTGDNSNERDNHAESVSPCDDDLRRQSPIFQETVAAAPSSGPRSALPVAENLEEGEL